MLNDVLRSRQFNVLYIASVIFFTALSLRDYPGSWLIFLLFTFSFNYLLLSTLNKQQSFFAFYLALLLWLGFWFKTVATFIFFDGLFWVPVGLFDYSSSAFDRALIVASVGALGLIVAFNYKYIFQKKLSNQSIKLAEQSNLYKKYKSLLWVGFVLLALFVTLSNMYLGIYQRGLSSQMHLPFGMNGVYKWLLLFGLTTFSAWLLYGDICCTKKLSVPLVILALSEIYVSGISLLSRATIVTAFAFCLGLSVCIQQRKVKVPLSKIISIALFVILGFVTSLYIAQKVRVHVFYNNFNNQEITTRRLNNIILEDSHRLVVNRWVGIDGVMAISSHKELGFPLLKEAAQEKYRDYGVSFFDDNILKINYLKPDMKQWHYITLPGVIAFSFYAGSYAFVFIMMLVLGLMGLTIESMVNVAGRGNMMLTSLLSMVLAYRLAHFGYVPGQSYLLLGAMCANLLLIYFLNELSDKRQRYGENKLAFQ